MNHPLKYIPLSQLFPSRTPLRNVRKNTIEYVELVGSIQTDGILQPVIVRKCEDGRYEVVEGNNRYEAARESFIKEMPCVVMDLTDDEVLILQLKANAVRPRATASYDYARRLRKILKGGESLGGLSAKIDKSPSWIRRMLSLNNLIPEASEKVANGAIKMTKAIELARLPQHLQGNFVGDAVTLTSKAFADRVREAKRDFDAYLLKSRLDNWEDGIVPKLRNIKDVMLEAETFNEADLVLTACEATTPTEGWKACLAWVTRLDPVTIKRRKEGKRETKLGLLNDYEWRVKQRELIENLTFHNIKYGADNE